jgi:acyl carrier protein
MLDRVCAIVARVLQVPPATVTAASSPDTLQSWDSLHHLQIVLALEEEFGIEFSVEEIAALQSVEAIVEIIRERQQSDAGSRR